MDLGGILARGIALISLSSTKHFQNLLGLSLLSTEHFQNGFRWISCTWIYIFYQILTRFNLELSFWSNFRMVLHGFVARISKNMFKLIKTNIFIGNLDLDPKNDQKCFRSISSLGLSPCGVYCSPWPCPSAVLWHSLALLRKQHVSGRGTGYSPDRNTLQTVT